MCRCLLPLVLGHIDLLHQQTPAHPKMAGSVIIKTSLDVKYCTCAATGLRVTCVLDSLAMFTGHACSQERLMLLADAQDLCTGCPELPALPMLTSDYQLYQQPSNSGPDHAPGMFGPCRWRSLHLLPAWSKPQYHPSVDSHNAGSAIAGSQLAGKLKQDTAAPQPDMKGTCQEEHMLNQCLSNLLCCSTHALQHLNTISTSF